VKENSIEEDIKILDEMILNCRYKHNYYDEYAEKKAKVLEKCKKALKENEELKKSKITYEKVRDIQEKNRNIVDNKYIPKQIVKDKISERQFELQQEYKDFEDDSILLVLQELLEGRK
jgi:formyltetrahydrofolate synthetase